VQGLSQTALAAMLMRRYMHEYHAPRSGFAGFTLNAHTNGAGNPKAMFRKAISVEAYQSAAVVCDPLNMFDVAPNCDGAAALLLARADLLPAGYSHPRVHITASALATDTLALHDRSNPLVFTAVQQSVERACTKARITPLQVDFFELYDSTSIFAALSLEGAGFASPGEGWRLAQNEFIGLSGSLPIGTMGGLKARGNPGGATGVYQAVEAVLQLCGLAGKNQVPDARRGMIQCLGGPASTAVTHIFEVA
jgi:acetyl-CoA C-acetyltransferase